MDTSDIPGPRTALKVLAGHMAHILAPVSPAAVQPLLQGHAVLPSSDQLPTPHGSHDPACPANVPAGQGTHCLPASLPSGETKPLGHAWHPEGPRTALKVLVGHLMHMLAPVTPAAVQPLLQEHAVLPSSDQLPGPQGDPN